jgi:DNA-directed RNA polymerase
LSAKQHPEKLTPVLDSLNQLGSTAWIINRSVLDHVIGAFTRQKEHADFISDLSIPVDPQLLREPVMPQDLHLQANPRYICSS